MTGNPLRDETTAFHWVLASVVVLALVVAASWVSTWLGLAVVVLLVALAAWRLLLARRRASEPPPPQRADVEDTPGP